MVGLGYVQFWGERGTKKKINAFPLPLPRLKFTSKKPLGLEQFEKFERRTDKIDKIAKYSTVEEVPIFSSIKIINTGKGF